MPIRVLCLGAYANGNVGDMYQAEALAAAVRALRPDADIVSVSPSKRMSAYSARNHTAGPVGGAFDLDFINSFDMLLVGGGGLLSAPHAPLNDAAWVAGLRLPVVAVSVGAAGDTPLVSKDFVQKCHGFSVRDEFSAAAIGGLRDDVVITMDPILLMDEAGSPEEGERQGILWVPGKIVPGTRDSYLGLMRDLYDAGSDHIVSFNPETDRRSGFDEVFEDRVEYLDTVDRFKALARTKRFVVSERYHGCILALTTPAPCVGLALRSEVVTSKITELFRRIGATGCLSDLKPGVTRGALRKQAEQIDFPRVHAYLAGERARLLDFLGAQLPA